VVAHVRRRLSPHSVCASNAPTTPCALGAPLSTRLPTSAHRRPRYCPARDRKRIRDRYICAHPLQAGARLPHRARTRNAAKWYRRRVCVGSVQRCLVTCRPDSGSTCVRSTKHKNFDDYRSCSFWGDWRRRPSGVRARRIEHGERGRLFHRRIGPAPAAGRRALSSSRALLRCTRALVPRGDKDCQRTE